MSDERDNANVQKQTPLHHPATNTPKHYHANNKLQATPSKSGLSGGGHEGSSLHGSMSSMGGVNSATPAKSLGGMTTTTLTERQHSSVSGYDDSLAGELNNGGYGTQDWPRSPYSGRKIPPSGDKKIGHRRVDESGAVTYKKIQSSQITGSIQLGIQTSVGGLANRAERDLLMKDFMEVEILNMDRGGSATTPAHKFSDFKFKVYAPIAFRYFRELFNIKPEDYLMSLTSEPLRELTNPGASGSMFFLSHDDEFIIKTVQHKEAEFLLKLLPGYYMNLNQNPRTLLPKFFGMYSYLCLNKNVRLIVMNNLLPSSIKMHLKYDLKGSTYKRKATKSECEKATPTFKDLDFLEHHPDGLLLESDTYQALIKTIQRDCRVLESFKIMDYSLLVGIYNLDQAKRDKDEARRSRLAAIGEEAAAVAASSQSQQSPRHKYMVADTSVENDADLPSTDSYGGERARKMSASGGGSNLTRSKSINRQRLAAYATVMESIHADPEPVDDEDDVPPGGIPARNSKGERLYIYLGIIDILQSYRLKKKLEHTFKSMFHDADTISVHRPAFYAQRFMDFMADKVFKKIPSPTGPVAKTVITQISRFDHKYVPVLPTQIHVTGPIPVTVFNTDSPKMVSIHHSSHYPVTSRMSSSMGYGTGTGTTVSGTGTATPTHTSNTSTSESNTSRSSNTSASGSLTSANAPHQSPTGPISGIVTTVYAPMPETPQHHRVLISTTHSLEGDTFYTSSTSSTPLDPNPDHSATRVTIRDEKCASHISSSHSESQSSRTSDSVGRQEDSVAQESRIEPVVVHEIELDPHVEVEQVVVHDDVTPSPSPTDNSLSLRL